MPAISGTFYFDIDGVTQWATGDCELDPGFDKREPRMASFGLVGFSAEPQAAHARLKILDRSGFDVRKLGTLDGSTIQIRLVNGKSWMLRNAFCTGEVKVQVRSGEIDVEFIGTAEEIVA